MDITTIIITFVVGIITPIILQIAKNKGWQPEGWQVQLIALGVAIVTAIIALLVAGKFDTANAVATITLCFATTELCYNQLVKKIIPPVQ